MSREGFSTIVEEQRPALPTLGSLVTFVVLLAASWAVVVFAVLFAARFV
jgi:hypothetical protein